MCIFCKLNLCVGVAKLSENLKLTNLLKLFRIKIFILASSTTSKPLFTLSKFKTFLPINPQKQPKSDSSRRHNSLEIIWINRFNIDRFTATPTKHVESRFIHHLRASNKSKKVCFRFRTKLVFASIKKSHFLMIYLLSSLLIFFITINFVGTKLRSSEKNYFTKHFTRQSWLLFGQKL